MSHGEKNTYRYTQETVCGYSHLWNYNQCGELQVQGCFYVGNLAIEYWLFCVEGGLNHGRIKIFSKKARMTKADEKGSCTIPCVRRSHDPCEILPHLKYRTA